MKIIMFPQYAFARILQAKEGYYRYTQDSLDGDIYDVFEQMITHVYYLDIDHEKLIVNPKAYSPFTFFLNKWLTDCLKAGHKFISVKNVEENNSRSDDSQFKDFGDFDLTLCNQLENEFKSTLQVLLNHLKDGDNQALTEQSKALLKNLNDIHILHKHNHLFYM